MYINIEILKSVNKRIMFIEKFNKRDFVIYKYKL